MSFWLWLDKGGGGGGARPPEDDVTHRILEEPTAAWTRVWTPEAALCNQHVHRQRGERQNKLTWNFILSCLLFKTKQNEAAAAFSFSNRFQTCSPDTLIVFGYMVSSLTQWTMDGRSENYARRLTRQCLSSSQTTESRWVLVLQPQLLCNFGNEEEIFPVIKSKPRWRCCLC